MENKAVLCYTKNKEFYSLQYSIPLSDSHSFDSKINIRFFIPYIFTRVRPFNISSNKECEFHTRFTMPGRPHSRGAGAAGVFEENQSLNISWQVCLK